MIAYTACIATSNNRSRIEPILVNAPADDRHHVRADARAAEIARKMATRLNGRAMTVTRPGARPVRVDA